MFALHFSLGRSLQLAPAIVQKVFEGNLTAKTRKGSHGYTRMEHGYENQPGTFPYPCLSVFIRGSTSGFVLWLPTRR